MAHPVLTRQLGLLTPWGKHKARPRALLRNPLVAVMSSRITVGYGAEQTSLPNLGLVRPLASRIQLPHIHLHDVRAIHIQYSTRLDLQSCDHQGFFRCDIWSVPREFWKSSELLYSKQC